jgi:hypothetical protein
MAGRGTGRSTLNQPRRRRGTADRPSALKAGAEQIRRGGGLRRLPDLLTRVLDPAARRRGLAEAKLLTEWSTIVGPGLAARCHAIRLSRRTDRFGGILLLHVAGAAALELQHSEPQILERINGFFGYDAVSRLRLIQAPLPRRAARRLTPVIRSVSDAEEIAIAGAVRDIRDPGLRAALQSFGRTLKGWPSAIAPGAEG